MGAYAYDKIVTSSCKFHCSMGENEQTAVHLIPLCDGEGMEMQNEMVPKNNPFAIPCLHALLMHSVHSTVLSGENRQSGILQNHPISYTLYLMPITYYCIKGRNGQSGIVSHLLYTLSLQSSTSHCTMVQGQHVSILM